MELHFFSDLWSFRRKSAISILTILLHFHGDWNQLSCFTVKTATAAVVEAAYQIVVLVVDDGPASQHHGGGQMWATPSKHLPLVNISILIAEASRRSYIQHFTISWFQSNVGRNYGSISHIYQIRFENEMKLGEKGNFPVFLLQVTTISIGIIPS